MRDIMERGIVLIIKNIYLFIPKAKNIYLFIQYIEKNGFSLVWFGKNLSWINCFPV